jgi:hypothetical protein
MKRSVFAFALAGLLLVGSASAALATTTKIPFTAAEMNVVPVSTGTITLVGTVYSVRGAINEEVYTAVGAGSSYVSGAQTAVVNYDLDLATGIGSLWGSAELVPSAYPDGGYRCSWQGTFLPSTYLGPPTYAVSWTGKSICHGFGTLAGWQSRADITLTPPAGATTTGYVFMPGDK